MNAKKILGQYIRFLRQSKGLSQQIFSEKVGISYQYLSGLEKGRENFTVNILECLSEALGLSFPVLVADAYDAHNKNNIPDVNKNFFRTDIPLPPGLNTESLSRAMTQVQYIIAKLNARLIDIGAGPFSTLIQGNNFSGVVSNLLTKAIHEHSPYKDNSEQKYPDLICRHKGKSIGLEVKTTKNVGKGGESHNGHSGWHLLSCYEFLGSEHNIRFIHIMCAYLNSHKSEEPDWKYLGSRVNSETGSQRTETYITNIYGTTKLRDSSVYLDDTVIDFSRWKQKRRGEIPYYSIFCKG